MGLLSRKNSYKRQTGGQHGRGDDEIERRVVLLSEGLRSSGMRLTHQRLEVAREIAAMTPIPTWKPSTVGVRERVPTMSLDTVYRTIAALVELGLVDRVSSTRGPDPLRRQHERGTTTSCASDAA